MENPIIEAHEKYVARLVKSIDRGNGTVDFTIDGDILVFSTHDDVCVVHDFINGMVPLNSVMFLERLRYVEKRVSFLGKYLTNIIINLYDKKMVLFHMVNSTKFMTNIKIKNPAFKLYGKTYDLSTTIVKRTISGETK